MAALDECQDCKVEDCAYGLSNISAIVFIVLCSITGFLAILGNSALLIVFVYGEMVRSRIKNYFVLSLTVADMLIGLTMTPLYICYICCHLRTTVAHQARRFSLDCGSHSNNAQSQCCEYRPTDISCVSFAIPPNYYSETMSCCHRAHLVWICRIWLAATVS